MSRPAVEELPELLGEGSAEAEERLTQFYAPFVTALAEQILAAAAEEGARREVEDLRLQLASLINQLPDRQKIVLTLYYYEGLTNDEIALVLGVTPPTVRNHHKRAIQKLHDQLLSQGLLDEPWIGHLMQGGHLLGFQETESPRSSPPEGGRETEQAFSETRQLRRDKLRLAGLLMETHPIETRPPSADELHAAEVEAGSGRPLADFVSEGRN